MPIASVRSSRDSRMSKHKFRDARKNQHRFKRCPKESAQVQEMPRGLRMANTGLRNTRIRKQWLNRCPSASQVLVQTQNELWSDYPDWNDLWPDFPDRPLIRPSRPKWSSNLNEFHFFCFTAWINWRYDLVVVPLRIVLKIEKNSFHFLIEFFVFWLIFDAWVYE